MNSLKKTLIGAGITGIFFLGYGCSRFFSGHDRYLVRTYHSKPFVIDRDTGDKQEILEVNGNMQVGDLKYRLQGILEDEGLERCLRKAEKQVEPQKLFKQPPLEWTYDR